MDGALGDDEADQITAPDAQTLRDQVGLVGEPLDRRQDLLLGLWVDGLTIIDDPRDGRRRETGLFRHVA